MVDTLPPALLTLLAPVNQRYMQTWAPFDPTREIAKIKVPILIVQGETDIQIDVSDAQALKDAQPNAELVLLPGMNHVMKAVADTTLDAQASSYMNPRLPVVPALIQTVAGFIGRIPGGK